MKRVLVEMPPIMKQVLDVHNHSDLDIDMLCDQLIELGWTAEFDCRISRTMVYSDCPQHIVDENRGDEIRQLRKEQAQREMYEDPVMNWSGLR